MSFGISDVAANMTVPAQTTIGVDGRELGRKAADFLIARLTGDSTSTLQFLAKPQLVNRGSTAVSPQLRA